MDLKLISSVVAKRFDNRAELCADGRGGWILSQVNVDRWITSYSDYWLLMCLGVLVRGAKEDDYVEATRLTATLNEVVIGKSVMEWMHPNPMWGYEKGDAIFEWPQGFTLQPDSDGLITIDVEAKLQSESNWLPVSGHAYCRIKKVEPIPELERRWISSIVFSLRGLIPRRLRRRAGRFVMSENKTSLATLQDKQDGNL